MENFDMIPPGANEVFGFNKLPDAKLGMVDWKVISVVVILFALGVIIGREVMRKSELAE